MKRVLTVFLFACLWATLAFASPRSQLTHATFNGPGSRGFLPACGATIQVDNQLLRSDSFASPWGVYGDVTAPTLTTLNATGPDGSANTASTLVVPATSGAHVSVLYQTSVGGGNYPYTFGVWAKVTSGSNMYLMGNVGSTYVRTPINGDGNWHFNYVFVPGSYFPTPPQIEIGSDLRDTGHQTATSGATVLLWHAQAPSGQYAAWPHVTTTSAAASAPLYVPCPSGIAFRDYSRLIYSAQNPINAPNAHTYNNGATAEPYVNTSAPFKVGSLYYAATECSATATTFLYQYLCLWSSPTLSGLWTEVSGSNPIASYNQSTNGLAGAALSGNFLLHPVFAPSGCTVATVAYTYCIFFSANNGSNVSGVYLLYSNTITGPYTLLSNGTTATAVLPPTSALNTGLNGPGLPAILSVGGTYYMYVANVTNTVLYTSVYTFTPSTNFTAGGSGFLTFGGNMLQVPAAGNWDSAAYDHIDSWVTLNKCGFYEYNFTALFNANTGPEQTPSVQYQLLGQAVSNNPLGPWWPGPSEIFRYGNAAFGPTSYVGNSNPVLSSLSRDYVFQSSFASVGNASGGSTGKGTQLVMPDACQMQ